MKKTRRILFPILALGAMVITSCSSDLAIDYTPEDQVIPTEWVDYSITPTGVKFAAGEENLYLEWNDEPHQYNYSITPKGATSGTLVWTSSNESAATVANGVLTPVGPGATRITVSEANDAFTPVSVEAHITKKLNSFTVSAPTTELDINKSYTLTPAYEPSDTTYTELIWNIPEAEEQFASINNGVLTTKGDRTTDTTLHVTVSSDACDTVQTLELHLKDRKIHVNSVSIALGQGASSELEVGETSSVVASVDPDNADDLAELKYYSREPEIASVDPDTGVITALKEGDAHIFAHCEDKDSEDVLIKVYEVYATALSIDKSHDYTVSNDDAEEQKIAVSYETDRVGASMPTKARAVFASSDQSVVLVDKDTGVLTAVSTGTATITASVVKKDGSLASDTVSVTSSVYATSVSISGEYACYLDSTVTLTASVSPVSAVDNTVSWTWTPETRATGVASGNSITLTPTEEGPLVVKATSAHFGESATHTVSFSERPVVFEENTIYLVGDKEFNTGSSVTGQASWTKAKYAYKFTEVAESDDPEVLSQVKATIHFNAGDQWKLREGPYDDGWKQLYEYEVIDGESKKVEYYQIAGALDGVYMRPDSNKDGNIHVLVEGSYDIYYKVTTKGYRIYVGLTPTISFDKSSLTMGSGASTTITLHNYVSGAINITNSDPTVATVSSGTETASGWAYTVTAGSANGTTTITATDIGGNVATCVVTVDTGATGVSVPIYLNANGIFDEAGAVPFVRAFKPQEAYRDLLMVKASGQDIIYTADIPEDYGSVIFVRMPNGSTSLDWDTAWNQSKDDDAAYGSNNMFTITGYETIAEKSYLTGLWGIYDEHIHYSVPADYYLAGTFNGWTTYDENYSFTKINNDHYQISNIHLEEGSSVKVHDKDLRHVPEDESGSHWYSNASAYNYYDVEDDGYGGKNILLTETNDYDIDFYPHSEYANTIIFSLHQEGGGGGDEPAPGFEHKYYIKGIGDDWSIHEEYGLIADAGDPNHYYLLGVSLALNETIKVFEPTGESTGNWYGNLVKTDDQPYSGPYFTSLDDGNLKVLEAGTYTVDFYVNASSSINDTNHISIYNEAGNVEEYNASIVFDTSVISTWTPATSDYSVYVWTRNLEHPAGEYVECRGNLNDGVLNFTYDREITKFIFYFYQSGGELKTVDTSCSIKTTGTYTLDISGHGWSEGLMTGVTLTKTSDQVTPDPVSPDPGPDPVDPDTYTYTITGLPSWVSTDNAKVFVWVWYTGGNGWVSVTVNGTTGTFTVEHELDGFKVVRCQKDTVTPNWNETENVAGKIYNQTGDITCTASVYTYAVTMS